MWPFGKAETKRFVDEHAFRQNMANQAAMAPVTVAQLHQAGMTPNSRLRLEYFFYAASQTNGDALAKVLREKGYSTECRPAADGSPTWCITGWTTPFSVDERSASSWTGEMCLLGFAHDCEFDGWGTNPEQPEPQN
jgi:hypothetical protein